MCSCLPRSGAPWSPCLSVLALLLLTGCGQKEANFDPETSLFSEGAAEIVGEATTVGTFRFLGFVTAAEGDLQTERISALTATDRPGEIAVADLPSCQVIVIDVQVPQLVRRVGHCGDGPGEFAFIAGAGAWRDTVYGFDASRRQVLTLTPEGTEVRRDQLLEHLPEGFGGFEWNAMVGPGQYLVTRSIGPVSGAGLPDWRMPVVLIDVRGDSTVIRPLPVRIAAMVERNSTATNSRPSLLRACVQPLIPNGVPQHVVITHGLGVETVLLDGALRPKLHTRTGLDWMVPQIDSGGRILLGAKRWYAACGNELYAVGYRAFDGTDERGADTRGYLEVRRYDGSIVAARSWGVGESSDVAIGAPKALLGDTLVTLQLDADGWQRVALWEVGS